MSSRNASPSNDSKNSSPEPTMCDCQNQLAHYDWNGSPRKDLRDLCKRTMGIPLKGIENVPISQENGEISTSGNNEDASGRELDPEWDPEWDSEHMKIMQAKRKDSELARNAGGNAEGTSKRGDTGTVVVDEAEGPPCANNRRRKRKMLDKENSNWIVHVKKSRNSKKGMGIRIKLCDREKLRMKISVEIGN